MASAPFIMPIFNKKAMFLKKLHPEWGIQERFR